MYLHIVTKQGKDPSTKRKVKRQRWHSGLKVDKVVSDTLRQARKCLFSDVDILTIVHISLSSPQPTSASELGDNSILRF